MTRKESREFLNKYLDNVNILPNGWCFGKAKSEKHASDMKLILSSNGFSIHESMGTIKANEKLVFVMNTVSGDNIRISIKSVE